MKYAAIVTYTTNERTGAVVCADSLSEAWAMVLDEFGGGETLQSVWISRVVTPAHDVLRAAAYADGRVCGRTRS